MKLLLEFSLILAVLGLVTLADADAVSDAKALIADFNSRFKLRISDEDIPAFTRDETAVKALDHVLIVANNGLCLDVSDQTNEKRGDFRANLVVVLLLPCDPSKLGQQWSVVTRGKHIHDIRFDGALIVSEFNHHVIDLAKQAFNAQGPPAMFAAGGRAVGDGDQIFTQQFFFSRDWLTKSVPLVFRDKNPRLGNEDENIPHKGASCLTIGNTAANEPRIRISICDPNSPLKDELFRFVKNVNVAASPAAKSSPPPVARTSNVIAARTTTRPAQVPTRVSTPVKQLNCPDAAALKRELQVAINALQKVAALLN